MSSTAFAEPLRLGEEEEEADALVAIESSLLTVALARAVWEMTGETLTGGKLALTECIARVPEEYAPSEVVHRADEEGSLKWSPFKRALSNQ